MSVLARTEALKRLVRGVEEKPLMVAARRDLAVVHRAQPGLLVHFSGTTHSLPLSSHYID
jgi:hypothetical protein